MKFTLFILTVCVFILSVTPAMSHHGRSYFKRDDYTSIEGTVTYFRWRNPHVNMEVKVVNENNETETWLIEGGTPTSLKRQGWKKDSIKLGDTVAIIGNPTHDPEKHYLLLAYVVREDGKTFYVSNSQRAVIPDNKSPILSSEVIRGEQYQVKASEKENILPSQDFSGNWTRGPNTFVVTNNFFKPPRDWPLTNIGEAQVARFDGRDNPSYECKERGLPFYSVFTGYFSWNRNEDKIEISSVYSALTRTLYLNQSSHPDKIEPSLVGHSIAHFVENGSLLVDTIGFPDDVRWGLAPGLNSSNQKHIKERYTLNEDGLGMTFSITIEDPVYLSEPLIINGTYQKFADVPIEPFECDLDAASRSLSPP